MVATFLVKHSLSEAAIEEFYKLLHNPDFDTAELAIKSAKGLRRSLKEVRSKMMEPVGTSSLLETYILIATAR